MYAPSKNLATTICKQMVMLHWKKCFVFQVWIGWPIIYVAASVFLVIMPLYTNFAETGQYLREFRIYSYWIIPWLILLLVTLTVTGLVLSLWFLWQLKWDVDWLSFFLSVCAWFYSTCAFYIPLCPLAMFFLFAHDLNPSDFKENVCYFCISSKLCRIWSISACFDFIQHVCNMEFYHGILCWKQEPMFAFNKWFLFLRKKKRPVSLQTHPTRWLWLWNVCSFIFNLDIYGDLFNLSAPNH